MGVVNTTYTFTSTDTITSAKMNNIIDETTFTGDAIQGTTLQVVSPGKLAVSAGGITSNEMAANSVVTAAITDSNVTAAKIADANVTQAKLSTNVVGNGPIFRASASGTTTLFANVLGQIILATENFDTNNNFSISRFTPTIAGYYQVSAGVQLLAPAGGANFQAAIYKFTSSTSTLAAASRGTQVSGTAYNSVCSDIIYLNGAGDYIELYGITSSGATVVADGSGTYMSGCLIRSA
jgi:hypothetical protein